MKRKSIPVLLAVAMILMAAIPAAAQSRASHLHSITNLEFHSQSGENDYLVQGFAFTKLLKENYTGIVTYLNKYDLDDNQTGTHIANVSLNNNRSKRLNLLYSYAYYSNPENLGAGTARYDTDRFLFLLRYKFIDRKNHTLSTYTSFTTATDFSARRSVNEKLKYSVNATERLNVALSGQYSYNFNESDNIFNLYALEFKYALCKKAHLNFGYTLVDYQAAGIDDDDIFKIGIFWTFWSN